MQGGKSRLDRLFDLLESEAWALGCVSSVSLCFQGGSSAATRHAAAEQIGLVYAAYPDTVATLLAKVPSRLFRDAFCVSPMLRVPAAAAAPSLRL